MVFISHSTKDQVQAKHVFDMLERLGEDPFLSSISIEPGADWKKALKDNMNAADYIVALLSKASLESDPVKLELGHAYYTEKPILPILLDVDVQDIPEQLRDVQMVSYSLLNEKTIKSFIRNNKTSPLVKAGVAAGIGYILYKVFSAGSKKRQVNSVSSEKSDEKSE